LAPTLDKDPTTYLRVGPWSILITAAAKGLGIGQRIRSVKHRPINRHQSIPTKERRGHLMAIGQDYTPGSHQRLESCISQCPSPPTQCRITHLGLSEMYWAQGTTVRR